MWEEIRRNKRRSKVLLLMMALLLVGTGITGGFMVDPQAGPVIGGAAALLIWLVLTLSAMASGDKILLSHAGARRIEKEDHPQLWNVVEEMCLASGMSSQPDVYIMDDNSLNAFAVGRSQDKAAVAITSGLLKRLNRDELQGVIGHEIAHIKNLDAKFLTTASVMMGTIIILSDFMLRAMFYGGRGRRRNSRSSGDGSGQAQVVLFLIALAFIILAPIFAQMLYFSCSRKREYLADASSARFTRYPPGLASALEKIRKMPMGKQPIHKALTPLYIINPLQLKSSSMSLFSTHPPAEKRIAILRGMAGAGFAHYEAAFGDVVGGKCIGERSLAEEPQLAMRQPLDVDDPKQRPEKSLFQKETVKKLRQVNDLFNQIGEFMFLQCVCGMRFKIPPGFRKEAIHCPKCNAMNEVKNASHKPPKG